MRGWQSHRIVSDEPGNTMWAVRQYTLNGARRYLVLPPDLVCWLNTYYTCCTLLCVHTYTALVAPPSNPELSQLAHAHYTPVREPAFMIHETECLRARPGSVPEVARGVTISQAAVKRRRLYWWFWIDVFSTRVIRMSVEEGMESDSSPARSGEDHLKLIFDLCDQDKDGFITAQDFRSLGNEHFGNTQVSWGEREINGTHYVTYSVWVCGSDL